MHSCYFLRLNHQRLGKLGKLQKKMLAWFIHHIRNNITEFINSLLQYRQGLSTIKLGIVTHTFGLLKYIKWQEYHCTKRAGSYWELGDEKYRTESWEKMPLRKARKDAFGPVCNEDWHDIWGNKKWQHEVLHIFILFSARNIIPMTFSILCLQSKVKHIEYMEERQAGNFRFCRQEKQAAVPCPPGLPRANLLQQGAIGGAGLLGTD